MVDGKSLIQGLVDLPIMIPHPVIGIALLSIAGKNHWLGRLMIDLGVRLMGTPTGIVAVMLFVGLPFFVNTVKTGFEAVPRRLENVSRSLGASPAATFSSNTPIYSSNQLRMSRFFPNFCSGLN